MITATFALLNLSIATQHDALTIVVSPWLGDESEGKLPTLLIGEG